MNELKTTEERIITKAKSSKRFMKLIECPLVGINTERKTITLNKYNIETEDITFIEDLCKIRKVDLDVLKLMLKESEIKYIL